MWRVVPFVLAALFAAPDAASADSSTEAKARAYAELLAIGQRIYQDGVLPSGRPLTGIAQANVRRAGADAACATCHRRSGYGESEGLEEIRSITGPALFGKQAARPLDTSAVASVAWPSSADPAVASRVSTAAGAQPAPPDPAETSRVAAATLRNARIAAFSGTRQRPAYDDKSLAGAIRNGIDVTGRTMSSGMPRYALDDAEMQALTAYLATLSARSSPGVTTDKIHFATVIQPGVDAAKRRAMLDVLKVYLEDRNQGLRSEVRREQAGSVRLGRTFREWVLHVWELNGRADTWGRQLEAFNRRQPVFALIAGLGDESWRPIHEFSERFELPCIFPQTDLPVVENPGFYTVYLSRGIALEARALAKYLREQGEHGPVMQIFRLDDATSAAGADAFRSAWQEGAGTGLRERALDALPGRAFWQQLGTEAAQSTLILWLRQQDLADAQALTDAGSTIKALYLSSTLCDGRRTGLAAEGGRRVRLVYPQDLPQARETRLQPVDRWLRSRGIERSDLQVQMNTYLALTITTGVMSHAMDTFSREFLVESIEHRVGNAVEPSIYPRLSLGPGQRFASKGSYIVEVEGAEDRQLRLVSDWIVP
jgi:cytochrome c553